MYVRPDEVVVADEDEHGTIVFALDATGLLPRREAATPFLV
jgi:hypothetical protein